MLGRTLPIAAWGLAAAALAAAGEGRAAHDRAFWLRREDQRRILEGMAAKLRDAGQVFTHGENERLAAAVQSLVLRADLDSAAFTRFLAALAEPGEHLWDKGPLVDPARYAATENAKDLLRSLYVKLAMRQPPGPEPVQPEVLKTLQKLGS